jgi:polysaccharide export outer membrane protein
MKRQIVLTLGLMMFGSAPGARAQQASALPPHVDSRVPEQSDYIVGPQDVLNVTVFGEADFTGKYTVERDGTFTFPQLGRITGAGMSQRGIEQELKKQLADGYLKNPQVAVSIESYREQRILVLGEVRTPGEYQLAGDTTLLAALARAGSTTPAASREAIIVRAPKRPAASANEGEPAEADVIHIDLAALQAGNVGLNMRLQDGDTVTVPKAQSVFVSGQVRSPGAYSIDPGTTVLQVLSLAGGLSERGADGRIRIQRTANGKRLDIKAKLTDLVQPGDTLIVPERFF